MSYTGQVERDLKKKSRGEWQQHGREEESDTSLKYTCVYSPDSHNQSQGSHPKINN